MNASAIERFLTLRIEEKDTASVGQRIRAVGMCFYEKHDLEVGASYSLRLNPTNRVDRNCIEIIGKDLRVLATLNRDIAACIHKILSIATSSKW